MKLIPLSTTSKKNSGKYFAMVDDEDYERVMGYKWCATVRKHTIYAYAWVNKRSTPMQRFILNEFNFPPIIDHIDHNGLNNQKSNLRKCNHYENIRNRTKSKKSKSKYLGVHFRVEKKFYTKKDGTKMEYTCCNKWVATVNRVLVGKFDTEEEAARAYDRVAKDAYGEFANLNFPS